MRHVFSHTSAIRSLVFAALTAFVFAFGEHPGGDSFSISLNDRLLHQQHINAKSEIKTISLRDADANDELKVYYSECGKIGTGRAILMQDPSGKTLKRWTYRNSDGKEHEPMSFKVKDVPTGPVGIAYQSDVTSKPVLLVKVTKGDESLTSKR